MNEVIESGVKAVRPGGELVGGQLVSGKREGRWQGYIWQTGESIFLSKREKVLADAWLEGFDYRRCREAYREEFGREISLGLVKKWLRRGHVEGWLKEQVRERGIAAGWTREHWMAVMTEHLGGGKRLREGDLYGMRLIAAVQGFEQRDVANVINQINFVQKDGRA